MKSHSRLIRKQSKRFVERKKTRVAIIGVAVLAVTFLGVFSIEKIINLPAFTIEQVTVTGADADIATAIQTAAEDSLQGNYLGLVSHANTFFSSLVAIKNAVMAVSPRIKSVAVHRSGLQALTITVTEKTPAALVCAGLPDFAGNSLSLGQSDTCFFADATGLIYAHAPSFSGDIYNRYYVPSLSDDASSTNILGEYATSSTEFVALENIFSETKAADITASAVLMKDEGEYELYVRNPSPNFDASSSDSDMAVIYFNDARPFQAQFVNLISFWNDMVTKAKVAHQALSFEYIDIRYGSNVFYRLNK